jgi:hypothetical protein
MAFLVFIYKKRDQHVSELGEKESSSSNPSSGTAVVGGKKGLDDLKMG